MGHNGPQLDIVAPGATAEEAAAVIAAVEQFIRDHTVVVADAPAPESAWKRAALEEGVRRAPAPMPSWA